jgi:outer membrane protein assembly factor BamB
VKILPLFGKKKAQESEPSPEIPLFKEYQVKGATTGLEICNLNGEDAIVTGSLDSRGLAAISLDGDLLWNFDTGATVYSVAVGKFDNETMVFAGSNGKVFAVSPEGKKHWEFQMPATKSKMLGGLVRVAKVTADMAKLYGDDDVYHIATGKLNNEDVIAAMAGGEYYYEGTQVIAKDGHLIRSMKRKSLGMQIPIVTSGGLLDISSKGDTILMLAAQAKSAYGFAPDIQAFSLEGKVVCKTKVDVDLIRKNRYVEGGVQDKRRGKLRAGWFGDKPVAVIGLGMAGRSVAAIDLNGKQLWKYETAAKGDINAGVVDVAIGHMKGAPIVIAGTFNGKVHLISAEGQMIKSRMYESNITNVAYGKIKDKDAFAVGTFNGKIYAYLV